MSTNAAPKFTLTESSVTVIANNTPYTFQSDTPNYKQIRASILNEDWDTLLKCLTVASSIEQWAKGEFTVVGDTVFFKGDKLPEELNARILSMATAGDDPTSLFLFWERLSLNPSARSVKSLWGFMAHGNIPLDKDGFIVAYKAVKANYLDIYSGTVDNHPGKVIEYPRNKVSDDPQCACHEGLHVGSLTYAKEYGGAEGLLLIVRVDPANVVCVPYDAEARKMRVCKYEVVGLYTGPLNDTRFEDDEDEGLVDDPCDGCTDDDCDGCDLADGSTPKAAPKDDPTFADLDDMTEDQLLEVLLPVLRTYAAKHLHLVGASKIPGGKVVLVRNILEVR